MATTDAILFAEPLVPLLLVVAVASAALGQTLEIMAIEAATALEQSAGTES